MHQQAKAEPGRHDHKLCRVMDTLLYKLDESIQDAKYAYHLDGTAPKAWGVSLDPASGSYGILHSNTTSNSPWICGRFLLFHFPSPDHELAERHSLAALALIRRKDYARRVLEFPAHRDLCDLFAIGAIDILLHEPGYGLALALDAMDRLRTIAMEGFWTESNGRLVEALAPGEVDQDLPAGRLALPIFDTLRQAAEIFLAAPPSKTWYSIRNGRELLYSRTGQVVSRKTRRNKRRGRLLCWGEECQGLLQAAGRPIDWEPGLPPEETQQSFFKATDEQQ
ncbi:MAG: hypothetical protein V3573_11390 [Desulfovibrionaceae bacterium]